MAEEARETLEELREWLDRLIASLQHPQERRIAYGNVRHEYSNWGSGEEESVNIAIIYEVPGGSTCQLNISYSPAEGVFNYIDTEGGERVETRSVEEIKQVIEREIQGIPAKRRKYLIQQVDQWIEEGLSRSQMFGELNKLLQSEFLGGRINTQELQAAVQHVVKRAQQAQQE